MGDIEQLLNEYQQLINFGDDLQRGNYKWVDWYVKTQQKKKVEGWEQACVLFINEAIDLHKNVLSKAMYKPDEIGYNKNVTDTRR